MSGSKGVSSASTAMILTCSPIGSRDKVHKVETTSVACCPCSPERKLLASIATITRLVIYRSENWSGTLSRSKYALGPSSRKFWARGKVTTLDQPSLSACQRSRMSCFSRASSWPYSNVLRRLACFIITGATCRQIVREVVIFSNRLIRKNFSLTAFQSTQTSSYCTTRSQPRS